MLNAGIILQGQNPDLVNALSKGTQLATQVNANQRKNALSQLYQQQGAGIAAGEQGAVNALAALDPNAAIGVNQAHLGMDRTRLGMDQTRQTMDFSAEKMGFLRENAKRAAASHAAGLSAAEAAAQIDKMSKGLQGAGHFYTTGDKTGYNAFMQQNGLDPAEYPFEAFPAHAAQFEGAMDALAEHKKLSVGPDRTLIKGADGFQYYQDDGSRVLPNVSAPEAGFRVATPAEAASYGSTSGQFDIETGRFYPAPKAASTNVTVNSGGMTKGWEEIDKTFAKDVFVPWRVQGGSADARKLTEQLAQAAGALGSGAELTGPAIGLIPDIVQAWVNPEAIAVRERVEEVVQRNLREVLGAQFTEKEGARLIARAYNPSLEEGENKRRVDALLKQMVAAAEAKDAAVEYFTKHGTLRGFQGNVMTKRDFEFPEWGDGPSADAPATQQPQSSEADFLRELGLE